MIQAPRNGAGPTRQGSTFIPLLEDDTDADVQPLPESWEPLGTWGNPSYLECIEEARELERRRIDHQARVTGILRQEFGRQVRLTKMTSVDGRLIFVVDGCIPRGTQMHLYDCLEGDAFRRTEFARPETREFKHHITEYNHKKLLNTELYRIVEKLVHFLFPRTARNPDPLEVYRIYTNAVMFGDVAFVHRDSNEHDHVTCIVYPNPEWSSELGGETVFYDENNEIVESVEPRPDRICLFHGSIQHKGSPPGRLFYGSRYTMAFKFSADEPGRRHSGTNSLQRPSGGNDPEPSPVAM